MFIYAETALHHQGDLDYLIKLIDCAKKSNAEGVKFQVTIDHDEVMSTRHSLYNTCKNMLFSKEQWIEAFDYSKKNKLKIILMPCDQETMQLVLNKTFVPDFLDLHSISFYDNELLSLIKKSKIPLILGIGGRKGSELKKKFDYFGNQLFCLMVGFQSFPTNFKDINIEKIDVLKRLYPNVKIGYADHTIYNDDNMVENNIFAYNLGARIFEKHIAIDEGEERIDYISAIGKDKFLKLVSSIKNFKINKNNTIEVDLDYLSESEIIYRNREKFVSLEKS